MNKNKKNMVLGTKEFCRNVVCYLNYENLFSRTLKRC